MKFAPSPNTHTPSKAKHLPSYATEQKSKNKKGFCLIICVCLLLISHMLNNYVIETTFREEGSHRLSPTLCSWVYLENVSCATRASNWSASQFRRQRPNPSAIRSRPLCELLAASHMLPLVFKCILHSISPTASCI